MIKKYIHITRVGLGGYTETFENIYNAINGELDGCEAGDSITLTIIEMEEDEYNKLPEFMGW